MFDKNQLCDFLVKAKKATYAAGENAPKVINHDKSTTMVFKEGDWQYHDNYFGGEPYGGREVVFYKGEPFYMMVYYGQVNESVKDVKKIYSFLMKALKLIPKEKPYRGPEKYEEGNLVYSNDYHGEVNNFYGEEIIEEDGKEIYKARYIGGLVDQRK